MNRELEKLRQTVEAESGIKLGPDKTELFLNRLRKRIRALGLTSEEQYVEIIETDASGDELANLLDVMSTNHTFFYREPEHFHQLQQLLVRWAAEGKRDIKIWCAASSSGEEPYMLSMICHEVSLQHPLNAKILATDISTRILKRAIQGIYDSKQLEKLPYDLKRKYFNELPGDDQPDFQVIKSLRESVVFKRLNLSKFPFPLQGPIDIIFCRNVMIYFDLPLRQKIITQFERLLPKGGHLYLSHSENLLGVEHSLKTVEVSAYAKL